MSILIKGMEMPTNCDDCPLAGDFKCNLMPSIPALCKEYDMAVQNGKRLNNCPLVEVPPHGRLIDADALYKSYGASGNCNKCDLDAYKCQYYNEHTMMEFCELIDDAPTIIDAEEGE